VKKPITDYESEIDYWAKEPTHKLVLFTFALLIAAGLIWVVDKVTLITKFIFHGALMAPRV